MRASRGEWKGRRSGADTGLIQNGSSFESGRDDTDKRVRMIFSLEEEGQRDREARSKGSALVNPVVLARLDIDRRKGDGNRVKKVLAKKFASYGTRRGRGTAGNGLRPVTNQLRLPSIPVAVS